MSSASKRVCALTPGEAQDSCFDERVPDLFPSSAPLALNNGAHTYRSSTSVTRYTFLELQRAVMQLCAACEPCFHTTLKLMEITCKERLQGTAQERLLARIHF